MKYSLLKRLALLAFAMCCLAVAGRASGVVTTSAALLGSPASAQDADRVASERAPVVIWNRTVTEFRVGYDGRDPAERARRAAQRIMAVSHAQGAWVVARQPGQVGEDHGILFTINGELAFGLLDGDRDAESGETLEQAAEAAERRLSEALDARARQRALPVILRGIGISLLWTLVFVGLMIAFGRLRRRIKARIDPFVANARARAVIGGINFWPILGSLRQMIARILVWSIGGGLLYLWLTLVLRQFPYTEPWGNALGAFVLNVLGRLGWGVLSSAPDLFAAAVIFALAHAFARGVGAYFLAVEREEIQVPWLAEETARATRQLLTILIWGFAVVIAYPHIPGSDTDAFKGVSVILGLMISLGSAGLVNQIMSGLTVIYSHAYRRGDFVKIGEHEGRVLMVGLLTTRLAKAGGIVVSVPNAVVTANMSTNFTPAERGKPEVLTTSVTIGYDAPWRQVQELLLLAAKRTPALATDPAPWVMQRSLSDFYVEYLLVAYLTRREERMEALARLHEQIQDCFNEHGVQIMSPHFEGQPEKPVVVPRSAWFMPPASAEQGKG